MKDALARVLLQSRVDRMAITQAAFSVVGKPRNDGEQIANHKADPKRNEEGSMCAFFVYIEVFQADDVFRIDR